MASYDTEELEKIVRNMNSKEVEGSEKGSFNFLDYDTIKQGEIAMRILGLDAPEVQNFTDEGVKAGDPFGETLGNLAPMLAKEMGAIYIDDSGKKDKYDRNLIRLRNKSGEDFTDKSYYEGILQPDTFTSERHAKLYNQGYEDRMWNKDDPIDPNDLWSSARIQMENEYKAQTNEIERLGINPMKEQAFNQAEWAGYQQVFGGYNPYMTGDVEYPTKGANYDNTARSAVKTAFASSVNSIKAGYQGALASYNDILGDEANWDYRTSKAKEYERQQREMPTYVSSVADIKEWRDTGEYVAGLSGMMAPYLLGIAGSAIAASVVVPTATITALAGAGAATATTLAAGTLPMSVIYAGQTYNDMEGDMYQKNAGIALTSGIIMASLDRLGLKGLMNSAQVIKNNSHEVIAKAYMKKENKRILDDASEGMGPPINMEQARLAVQKAFTLDTQASILGLVGLVDLPLVRNLIIKQGGADFAQGAMKEGVTELAQEMTQYGASILGSEKEWESTEAGERALNAVIGGSVMGGMVGPVLGTPSAIRQQRILKSKFTVAKDQPTLNSTDSLAEVDARTVFDIDVEETTYPINTGQASSDDIAKDVDQHREVDNKLANKGLFQWIKDIPKNFISRPLRWYWKSEMHQNMKNSSSAQAVISLFSATNEDTISGEPIQDIETRLYNKFSNAVLDTMTRVRSYLGESSGKQGRLNMQKVLANIYKAVELRNRASLTAEEQKILTDIDKSLTQDQQNKLILEIDMMAAMLSQDIFDISGETINLSGQQFMLNMRPDKKKIKANQSKVREILKGETLTEKEIDRVISAILEAPEGSSLQEAYDSSQRKSIKDVNPGKLLPKRIGMQNLFNRAGMEEFATLDIISGMEATSRELIHNSLVAMYIGKGGGKLNRVLAKIKKEAGDNWDPKFAADITSAAEIWMGVYKPIQNKKLKELQANITSFNLITLLGTSGPAQLPELWAAFLGRIAESDGGRPLLADMKKIAGVVAKHYSNSASTIHGRFQAAGGMSYTDSWTPNKLRFGAGGYGGVKYGAIGQQGINAEEIKSSRLRSAVSNVFITVSLIKPLTDISRIGADFIGNDAIMHHLDVLDTYLKRSVSEDGTTSLDVDNPMSEYVKNSYDMLAETRIPPLQTLQMWAEMKANLNAKFRDIDFSDPDNFGLIEKEMVENYPELLKLMDVARKQWVDNSLANPGPSTKSRISNDPHYALLFQFRGYILTFAASIVPRLVKRAISGNPNVDINAITTMAGLVAMGFLGQAMKDEWKTDGRPYWLDDAEFVQRGIQASGMLGPFDFLLDSVNPIYGQASAWNSMEGLMGPTWGNVKQFSKIGKNTIAGESDAAIDAALKMIPIFGAKQSFRDDPIGTITNPILGER